VAGTPHAYGVAFGPLIYRYFDVYLFASGVDIISTIMSVDTSLIPSSYSIPLCPRLLVCCGNNRTQVKL